MFDLSLLGDAIFPLPPLKIGPLELHAFGFLVGTGIILGTLLAQRRARTLGLSEAVIAEVALWAVIPGFIGAHLVHQLFYFPIELVGHLRVGDHAAIMGHSLPLMDYVPGEPIKILKFWEGISSFGGFIGGTIGVIYYFKRKRRELPFLPYADALIFGFCFAWIFGRMGCTTAFDHPGSASDFFLAMEYGGGQVNRDGVRIHGTIHNLGFYEMMWTTLMFTVFWFSRKRPHFKGWYLAMFIVMYMPVRFMWDFLREVDVNYAGLTPGQWIAIVLFTLGLVLIWKRSKTTDLLVPDGKPRYEYWPVTARANALEGGTVEAARPPKKKRKA